MTSMDITWGAVSSTASTALSTPSLHHLDGCSDHRIFGPCCLGKVHDDLLDDGYDLVYKLLKDLEQLGSHTSARIRLAKSLSNRVALNHSDTCFAKQTDGTTTR